MRDTQSNCIKIQGIDRVTKIWQRRPVIIINLFNVTSKRAYWHATNSMHNELIIHCYIKIQYEDGMDWLKKKTQCGHVSLLVWEINPFSPLIRFYPSFFSQCASGAAEIKSNWIFLVMFKKAKITWYYIIFSLI